MEEDRRYKVTFVVKEVFPMKTRRSDNIDGDDTQGFVKH